MSILANKKTKIICQGILTPQGLNHTEQALTYGTNIVAGVASGKGGEKVLDVPLFNTLNEAVKATKPDMSVIFASPANAVGEIEKAILAKIKWIVCPVERIPVHDILALQDKLKKSKSHLIGPAAPGIVSADECKVGTMPAHLFASGNIGIMSRSSSVMYEAIQQLKDKGVGVSTCVALGAYPVIDTDFIEIFDLFQKDKKTSIVLLIGEVGGYLEQRFADYYKKLKRKKPLVSYIVGQFAPAQTYMGNISAIVQDETQTAVYKNEKLKQAGSVVIRSPAAIGDTVFKVLTNIGK